MRLIVSAILATVIVGCSDTSFQGKEIGSEPRVKTPCEENPNAAGCDGTGVKPDPTPSLTPYTVSMPLNLKSKQEIPLVKTILIVDNSASMAEEQALLAQGVRSFVNELKGKNVDLYLYTTTQFSDWVGRQWDNGTLRFHQSATMNLNATNLSFYNHTEDDRGKANTSVSIMYKAGGANLPVNFPAIPDITVNPQYDISFEYSLRPNLLGSGAGLSITQDMTDSELDAIKNTLATAVTNIGISPLDMSDQEEGLCTLVRLVYEQGQHAIFSEGDNVAFVILTDEDDQSSIRTCIPSRKLTNVKRVPLNRFKGEKDCANNACTPLAVRYHMSLDYNQIRVVCNETQNDDGVPKIVPVQKNDIGIWTCGISGRCETSVGTCNAYQNTLATNSCGASPVNSCNIVVAKVGAGNRQPAGRTFEYPMSGTDAQKCAKVKFAMEHNVAGNGAYGSIKDSDIQAAMNNASYPVIQGQIADISTCQFIYNYMNEYYDSSRMDPAIGQELSFFTPEQATAAASTSSTVFNDRKPLIDAFINKSKATFGDTGFFVSAIMRDPTADAGKSCPGQYAQNGTEYKKVVTALGAQGVVHSICDNSYADALAKVEGFIKTIVEKTYSVKLQKGEKITGITRIRAGVKTALVLGEDVKVLGGKIEFLKEFNKDDTYDLTIEGKK